MARKTILALGKLLPDAMDRLSRDFTVIRLWREEDPEETLRRHASEIVAIICNAGGVPVTERLLEALPNVELIANHGVGVDAIDLAAANARQIVVTNTPDIVTADTADLAFAGIITCLRRLVEADMFVRVGRWMNEPFPLSHSLTHKRVGIVGLGRIGQAIARRCVAFDMAVAYHNRRKKPDVPYQYFDTVEELAAKSDVLVLACPGGDETRNLVDAKILKALGPKGWLVNISRGSVVDYDALADALDNNELAGAALDVYPHEPAHPERLIKKDNVVLFPHIGSATQETRAKMSDLVVDNLHAYFNGLPVLTPVAPK